MQECKLLLCPVAFALEISGIRFGIATSTRIPMITRTTSSSVNENAFKAFPLNLYGDKNFQFIDAEDSYRLGYIQSEFFNLIYL